VSFCCLHGILFLFASVILGFRFWSFFRILAFIHTTLVIPYHHCIASHYTFSPGHLSTVSFWAFLFSLARVFFLLQHQQQPINCVIIARSRVCFRVVLCFLFWVLRTNFFLCVLFYVHLTTIHALQTLPSYHTPHTPINILRTLLRLFLFLSPLPYPPYHYHSIRTFFIPYITILN